MSQLAVRTRTALRTALKPAWGRVLKLVYPQMAFPTYSPALDLFSSADPVRFGTLALAIERLKTDSIPGAMAEIGVWRGATSKFLHTSAPDRKLYLFDTFQGFSNGDWRFKDTSVEAVSKFLGNPTNVEFRVGLFPATAAGLEDERFSFVMFDADAFEPTVSALEFFYPRLHPGGYFFLHDFNNAEYDWAVRRATTNFLRGKPEKIIEIPDRRGTAFFRKV
jgi:O-methyltransferase